MVVVVVVTTDFTLVASVCVCVCVCLGKIISAVSLDDQSQVGLGITVNRVLPVVEIYGRKKRHKRAGGKIGIDERLTAK